MQVFEGVHPVYDIFNHQNVEFWSTLMVAYNSTDFISCAGTNFAIRATALRALGMALSGQLCKVSFCAYELNAFHTYEGVQAPSSILETYAPFFFPCLVFWLGPRQCNDSGGHYAFNRPSLPNVSALVIVCRPFSLPDSHSHRRLCLGHAPQGSQPALFWHLPADSARDGYSPRYYTSSLQAAQQMD